MNLSLPTRFRLDNTWSAGNAKGRDSGFIDIHGDVPFGTCIDENNGGHSMNYSGYSTSFELNSFFNFWTVVRMLDLSQREEKWQTHVVLFPSRRWFDEWFKQIPERLKAEILLQGDNKTGVE